MSTATYCLIIPESRVEEYEVALYNAKLLLHKVLDDRVSLEITAREAHLQNVELPFPSRKRKGGSSGDDDGTSAEVTEKSKKVTLSILALDGGRYKLTFFTPAEREEFSKAVGVNVERT